jgi:hypothetical protein
VPRGAAEKIRVKGALASEESRRLVTLDHLVSRSISRAPQAFGPPLAKGRLFNALRERHDVGGAIDFSRGDEARSVSEVRGEQVLSSREREQPLRPGKSDPKVFAFDVSRL